MAGRLIERNRDQTMRIKTTSLSITSWREWHLCLSVRCALLEVNLPQYTPLLSLPSTFFSPHHSYPIPLLYNRAVKSFHQGRHIGFPDNFFPRMIFYDDSQ